MARLSGRKTASPRDAVVLSAPFTGFLDGDSEAVFPGEVVQRLFEPGQRVPVARNQQQHGEFGAKGGHPALFNIATAIENRLADVLDDTRSVSTNC